jgi:energy-coupling factor transport system permease protein
MTGDFHLPGSSFLHRTDPRARLMALAGFTACFLLPAEPLPLGVLAASCLAVVALTLGLRQLGGLLRALAPVLAFILVLTPVVSRDGAAILKVAGIPLLTAGGARDVIMYLARFTGISAVFFALLRTLRLEELVLALRWFGTPFPAALAITITFRYIPFLAGTWREVKDAHRLRGAAAGPGPLLTAIVVKAVKSIPALAMALEGKGLGRTGPRTSLETLGPPRRAAFHLAAVAAALTAIMIVLLLPGARRFFAVPGL